MTETDQPEDDGPERAPLRFDLIYAAFITSFLFFTTLFSVLIIGF